mmetsp:Transcript_98502/g.248700  ORF Transcript_98502/g.248700 Transcript_98502/m.248700 type:complete len:355 (+) Transcript_98502:127-1191(+)
MPLPTKRASSEDLDQTKVVQKLLLEAEGLAIKGRNQLVEEKLEHASSIAFHSGDQMDKSLAASAIILHANKLIERGAWPEHGPGLDVQLRKALQLAEQAKPRNRQLEGNVMQVFSCAVFAKPSKDAADIDTAIEARQKAVNLLLDAAIASLPWPPSILRSAVLNLAVASEAAAPLSFEMLREELSRRLGAGTPQCHSEAGLRAVFDSEASLGIDEAGEAVYRVVLPDFLVACAERAERVASEDQAAAAAARCAAPCEGGGAPNMSDLERALLALVARDGAGRWEEKASELASQGVVDSAALRAEDVAEMWGRMAPEVKRITDADEKMSCGHSCSTCPTRHDCKVHDAIRDIEDL